MASVLLECARCHGRNAWQLEREAQDSLTNHGACLKTCGYCHSQTYWFMPEHDRAFHPAHKDAPAQRPPEPPKAPRITADRPVPSDRADHRVPLRLPVRVRVWALNGPEEITTTRNVSRGGLYFESSAAFQVGQEVRVALNYSQKSAATALEQVGTVVRVEPLPDASKQRGVAVKYER